MQEQETAGKETETVGSADGKQGGSEMMINVGIRGHEYAITIGRGALDRAATIMKPDRKVLIVTDDGVPTEYSERVAAQCMDARILTLPQGEANKNFDKLQEILAAMVDHHMTRTDCTVAVGGGVVGDMTGLAAAMYMRGIDFYNIPTTVLAQVDSSVGGKTAIDFHGVKNIVGAFWQPRAVLIDPDTLSTLDLRQIRNGLAEAVKVAMTSDAELFALFELTDDPFTEIDRIIATAIGIKRDVVMQDEKERNLRAVLNFGHTLGHGIEIASQGALLHGEAIAVGMLPMCAPDAAARLRAVLRKLGLPTELSEAAATGNAKDVLHEENATKHDAKGIVRIDPAAVTAAVMHDKKSGMGGVKTVQVDRIGSFKFRNLRYEELEERLQRVICPSV